MLSAAIGGGPGQRRPSRSPAEAVLRRAELQARLAASYVKLWERNEARAWRAVAQAQTEHARWQARLVEITDRITVLQAHQRTGGTPRNSS